MSPLMRLALRNAFRRPLRTTLTAGMVVFAVALLLIFFTYLEGAMGGALANATAMSGHVRVASPAFVEREVLNPLEENLEQIAELVARLEARPGVVAVEPRINAGVLVSAGEEIGDVYAQALGGSEAYFRERLKANEKLVAGRWFTGAPDELVAGHKVVELLGAALGDELLLLGSTQDGSLSPMTGKLVGVVRGGGSALDHQILVPLERMQWLTDIPSGATELLVFGAHHDDGPALAKRLRTAPELSELTIQAWDEREPWSSLGATTKAMQTAIVLVVVFLAAVGILNTMMMSVLERTHELGVLRAMGLSRMGAIGMFVGEAAAIGLLGGLAGVGLGLWPSWALERHGLHIGEQTAASMQGMGMSETIHGSLSLEGVILAFGLGVLMAVLGSVLPAIRGASVQPVTAMRSGR